MTQKSFAVRVPAWNVMKYHDQSLIAPDGVEIAGNFANSAIRVASQDLHDLQDLRDILKIL